MNYLWLYYPITLKLSCLRNKHLLFHSFEGQEYGYLWFKVSNGAMSRIFLRAVFWSERLSWEGSAWNVSHGVVDKTQFFVSCWIVGLSSSLWAWRPPSVLCYLGLFPYTMW